MDTCSEGSGHSKSLPSDPALAYRAGIGACLVSILDIPILIELSALLDARMEKFFRPVAASSGG